MNTCGPVGPCRHPRPAPAPARRAQVHQGRRLVGARGHPIADRGQRTSKHPRGQARGSSAKRLPPSRAHMRRGARPLAARSQQHGLWPTRRRWSPHGAGHTPCCPRAEAPRVPVPGAQMKRTRFYQDPDAPGAFAAGGGVPTRRRDDGGGEGRQQRARAVDDPADSEDEEGWQPRSGARRHAPTARWPHTPRPRRAAARLVGCPWPARRRVSLSGRPRPRRRPHYTVRAARALTTRAPPADDEAMGTGTGSDASDGGRGAEPEAGGEEEAASQPTTSQRDARVRVRVSAAG